jgi:dTDP-glucose 4,6-dehydratase
MKTILVTGACGFIGHHFIEYLLQKTDWHIIILDKLSYASKGFQRLREIGAYPNNLRIRVFTYDLTKEIDEGMIEELQDIHYIVHLAAETHVDNSIMQPEYCIENNVMSTVRLLEFARKQKTLEKFLYFSTDEVYGPAMGTCMYKETDRHHPTNPYSASKSASEAVCLAYENTYKIPLMICNTMNVFGERQHVEKYIPICIRNILHDHPIAVHSYPGCEKPGSRFYIYAKNVASAVYFLLEHGNTGEKYNIPGEREIDNLEIVKIIGEVLQKEPTYELIDFHSKRPGHDLRYGLDGTKLLSLGWKPDGDIIDSLRKTVLWTIEHNQWIK